MLLDLFRRLELKNWKKNLKQSARVVQRQKDNVQTLLESMKGWWTG